MTDKEQVYQFLKRKLKKPYCDNCIAKATSLDKLEVVKVTMTLRLDPEKFVRWYGSCSFCDKSDKTVTVAM